MKRPATAQVSRKNLRIGLVLSVILCSALWQGCSAVPQSAAAPTQQSTPQSRVLPSSSVGAAYRQALVARASAEPVRLVEGQLPPGLALNSATGVVSGVPTQAGRFTFTILTNLLQLGQRETPTSFVYTLPVHAAATSINVQISPASASVTPGGKLQFSALVKNTSNTAVVWSASAGKISSTGLWTAPLNTTSNGVTVTAVSAANPSAYSTAAVAVGRGTFNILTASLPSGAPGRQYFASVIGTGGMPPYRWSLESGSLPSGLLLNSTTGAVSGSPNKTGTFSFSVRASDSKQQSTQRAYSIMISNSGSVCGPPHYECSRTDVAVVPLPAPPNVGNLTGANTVVSDPDFGNKIVRITDWNTDPGAPTDIRSYVTANSGSADENLWNLDSTMFLLQTLSSRSFPFTFDASSMHAARMYLSSDPTHGGMKLGMGGVWSRVDPNILYSNDSTRPLLNSYDFSDRTNPPTPQLVYDFSSSPNCLPAGFKPTWQSKGGVSAGDTVFGMAYSDSGNQGTGVYAVAYKVGSGCTVLNTQTGQVWGDWGTKGVINIPDRWAIHNVKISKDGNWLIVASERCLIASCSQAPYFWQIGTTNVSSCGAGLTGGQKCGGHWTEGYTHWVNNYDAGKYMLRPLSDPTLLNYVNAAVPPGVQDPLDQHASWNNADPADSLPFFLTYWSLARPFPGPWYNEIVGVSPDGSGKVWRFAHNFITGRSQIFSTEYGIGSVSQDGRFFIFSSDWMGTLGSQSGAANCTVGIDCRGDVFVLQLN